MTKWVHTDVHDNGLNAIKPIAIIITATVIRGQEKYALAGYMIIKSYK